MTKAHITAGLLSAAAAALSHTAHADATSFNFPSFSSDDKSPPQEDPSQPPPQPPRVRNSHPRTTSAGFDPEGLERGVDALKEITTSPHGKKVFEFIKKREETKQIELAAKAAQFKQMQAQHETERQQIIYNEQKKLAQHQAHTKSQMAKYEDELARKRMQAESEFQRARNQELVKLQEDSSIRQEQARRATEEQIQAQRRQTEREKAEMERETIRIRAIAEAEGRAHEAKLAEDVNRRKLVDSANAEREKWVAAINTTFEHIGGITLPDTG